MGGGRGDDAKEREIRLWVGQHDLEKEKLEKLRSRQEGKKVPNGRREPRPSMGTMDVEEWSVDGVWQQSGRSGRSGRSGHSLGSAFLWA